MIERSAVEELSRVTDKWQLAAVAATHAEDVDRLRSELLKMRGTIDRYERKLGIQAPLGCRSW